MTGNPASAHMQTMGGLGMDCAGHLYMQTNELRNAVVHYHRSANVTVGALSATASPDRLAPTDQSLLTGPVRPARRRRSRNPHGARHPLDAPS
jgi:hypothetical protein